MESKKAKYNRCINDFLADFAAGMKKIELARKYEIAMPTVTYWLKKNADKAIVGVVTHQHEAREANKEKELLEEKKFWLKTLNNIGHANNNLCAVKNSKNSTAKDLIDDINFYKCALRDMSKANIELIEFMMSKI